MLSGLLITLREGLEAALIVVIVLGYLRKTNQKRGIGYVWGGIITAIALSIITATGMYSLGAELEEPYEQIFEGSMMFMAVGVMTWMVFWMRKHSRDLKHDLEKKVRDATERKANWGLFGLTFLAVFREGLETAIFLTANAFSSDGLATLSGFLIGLSIAIGIGMMLYNYMAHFNLKLFFGVTSFLLMLFAAGMLMHGIHEFQEIGCLPLMVKTAWNTEWLLTNKSVVGSMIRSLVGYNSTPSVFEVAGYVGYWSIILLIFFLREKISVNSKPQSISV